MEIANTNYYESNHLLTKYESMLCMETVLAAHECIVCEIWTKSYISSECLLKRMFSPEQKLQLHQSHLRSCQFGRQESMTAKVLHEYQLNAVITSTYRIYSIHAKCDGIKIIQFIFTDIWPKWFWMHCKCVSVPSPNFHIWQLNAHFCLLLCNTQCI